MNDGGPAFPRPASEYTVNGTLCDGNDAITEQKGMTLRDYFATHASEEDLKIASEEDLKMYLDVQYSRAEARYRHADKMIQERSK